jgi:hypothetical protein
MSNEYSIEGDFEMAKTMYLIFLFFYFFQIKYFGYNIFFKIFFKRDCEKPVHCCKFNPKGDRFAVGLSDGSIKVIYFLF